jgi:plasmid maintenance system antidote protein VapI
MGAARNDRRGATYGDQLREAVALSGESLYAIARRAGVPRNVLARFVTRERSLTLESFERLGAALGLRLIGGAARTPRRTMSG